MVPAYAQTHVGSVGSEADTAHAAPEARSEAGTDGSGQKVCVLSDSYNQDDLAETTASGDIQSGDLPGPGNPIGNTTPVDVVEEGGDSNTDEGRAMLQLIHDIAPGAELGFHTAFGGLAVFAQGIGDLADARCTVIVDDIRYNIEPFYQDGPVSKAVNEVVEGEGVPYFTSAGNDGQNSYEAPFRDSGEPGILDSSSVAHDFNPSSGTDIRQKITLEAGGRFRIFAFQWTDPSSVVEGSKGADTDIDVALVNDAGTVVASSSSDNVATGIPLESIDYTNDTGSSQALNLTVEKFAGPDPEEIKYVYSGSGYDIQEYDTLGPTVYGHPVAERAIAVAAAPFFNTAAYNPFASPATLESFSSKGGIPILFDRDGDRISGITRQKPDVTGTDGVDNTFFGFDISDSAIGGIDSDPHPNFFGTSAAAPNVAAIAALVQAVRPGLSPTGVRNRLESTAGDVTSRQRRDGEFVEITGGEGVDPWSGHGFVRADRAVPTDQNDPPALSLSPDSGSIDENNSPPSAVASISIDDPDGGTNNLSLSGDDADAFQVDSTDLEFTAAADFESKSSYSVTVEVNDPNVGSEPDDSQGFTLSIDDVNEAPVISDLPEADTIDEDSSAGLISFTIEDPETSSSDLTISRNTGNPALLPTDSIEIGGSGSDRTVTATPNADSNGTARVTVTAADPEGLSSSSTLTLKVTPVNDPAVVEKNKALILKEGGKRPIPTDLLSASDVEDGASDIIFDVTDGPSSGTLLVGGSAAGSFTQASLEARSVSYVHDGVGTGTDSFTFNLRDAAGDGPTGQTFSIKVQSAAEAPAVTTNEGLTLTEGESAPITSAELEATDGDNAAGELTFEVTSGPSQGEIQVDGSQSSTFTQADINNELVSYDHTASSSDNDSFELEVSDPNGSSVSATFDVTVEEGTFATAGTVSYPSEEGVGSGTPSFTSGEGLGGVEVA
ncbi:cadherin-like domain-containing protein, partial [Salinibacter ruber]|uniref:cadherin-like domain-containing protein n=1 Tax=Salinibacter ruber TaxID=146919 RepID=UPI002167982C